MNKAGGIIAMVAGVFAVIAAIVTLMVGGLGSAFKADGADTIVGLGWGGIVFSFLVIVFGAVALFRPKGAGIGLIVCSLAGAILGGTIVAVFMVLSLIGGIVCVVGSRQKKESASASQPCTPGATEQNGEIFSQLERLADLKNKAVLTEEEFQSQKAKLLSGSNVVGNSVPFVAPAVAKVSSVPVQQHTIPGRKKSSKTGLVVACVLGFVLLGSAALHFSSRGRVAPEAINSRLTATNTAVITTSQTSVGAVASKAIDAPGANPSVTEPGQVAQSDASAPVQEPASKGTDHGLLASCMSGGQTPELACLSDELDRQDARLNKEYQRVMGQYKQLGQSDGIAALRKVELEWIKHVKSDCDTTPPEFTGNPDHQRIECRLDLTKLRADELAKMAQ